MNSISLRASCEELWKCWRTPLPSWWQTWKQELDFTEISSVLYEGENKSLRISCAINSRMVTSSRSKRLQSLGLSDCRMTVATRIQLPSLSVDYLHCPLAVANKTANCLMNVRTSSIGLPLLSRSLRLRLLSVLIIDCRLQSVTDRCQQCERR